MISFLKRTAVEREGGGGGHKVSEMVYGEWVKLERRRGHMMNSTGSDRLVQVSR